MARPTTIHIDTQALRHNVRRVRHYAPAQKMIAMVKANAYGHDLLMIAERLKGHVDAFGVACTEEAILIRTVDSETPIVLMEGIFNLDELALAQSHQLDIVVHQPEQLAWLMQTKLKQPLQVWLKVNTGMYRLGWKPEALAEAWQTLSTHPQLRQPPRLMTHFACADERENDMTAEQAKHFFTLTQPFAAECSLANSAGILAWPQTHAQWVRPGIMLYGVSPFAGTTGEAFDLQPVMTVQSQVIAVHQCQAGDRIGYGSNWQCQQATSIAVVAMGYGDGYPRHARNGTPVLINGECLPLVGHVSMDMLTVDLGAKPIAKVGDSVVLWGKGLPIEQVAECANTIPYELLCNIKKR